MSGGASVDAGDATVRFRALVLGDDAAQARLGRVVAADVFAAEARALAAKHGIALDEAAVARAIRPDPLGIGRFMSAPVTLERWPAHGWLPARSVPTGGTPAFDWAWFGTDRLTRPFFEEEVRDHAPRPFSEMFRTRTTLSSLIEGMGPDGPVPDGLVFHMSRCGSTLVAQMLAADPSHEVLSEPEPLDAVVRWALESDASDRERTAALRAIVAALGRRRAEGRGRLFLKLDSWHALALPLFRSAFPDTPWIFLYRDPIEIIVSQMRQRGMHTVAGLLSASIIDIPGAETMPGERYTAHVLARIGQAVLDHWHVGGGLLVDYSELPDAGPERIWPHFGLARTAAGLTAVAAIGARNAKHPGEPFVPDRSEKQGKASPAARGATETIARPMHDRLDALRRQSWRPSGQNNLVQNEDAKTARRIDDRSGGNS